MPATAVPWGQPCRRCRSHVFDESTDNPRQIRRITKRLQTNPNVAFLRLECWCTATKPRLQHPIGRFRRWLRLSHRVTRETRQRRFRASRMGTAGGRDQRPGRGCNLGHGSRAGVRPMGQPRPATAARKPVAPDRPVGGAHAARRHRRGRAGDRRANALAVRRCSDRQRRRRQHRLDIRRGLVAGVARAPLACRPA